MKELREEIILLNEEINDLRQKNLDLNERNMDLERELRSVGGRTSHSNISNIKVESKESDVVFWRDKCETLVRKYLASLRKLKEDNEKMKKDLGFQILELREEANGLIKKIRRHYKKVKT